MKYCFKIASSIRGPRLPICEMKVNDGGFLYFQTCTWQEIDNGTKKLYICGWGQLRKIKKAFSKDTKMRGFEGELYVALYHQVKWGLIEEDE